MAKKEKLITWHKKQGAFIPSKFLKEQKPVKEPLRSETEKSKLQAFADKFTQQIRQAATKNQGRT